MEEGNPLVSVATTGTVGSRFVTQSEIDSANERREADWKAAYARLGQEPPPRPTEDPNYDGRSLYERLQTQKTAKQEEWEEKTKLSNQFRALEEDEIQFLDGIMDEKITKENKRKQEENEELKNFREAVAQKLASQSAAPAPPVPTAKPPPTKPAMTSTPAKGQPKKNQKSLLKGAIVRKSNAPKAAPAVPPAASAPSTPNPSSKSADSSTKSPASSAPAPPSPAKDEPTTGQKRSEASLSEDVGATEDEAQKKRQRV